MGCCPVGVGGMARVMLILRSASMLGMSDWMNWRTMTSRASSVMWWTVVPSGPNSESDRRIVSLKGESPAATSPSICTLA